MSKLVLFAILTSAAAVAQQRGMYGGVSTGQMVGTVNDPGFGSRLGATVSGLPQIGVQGVTPGIYGGGGNRGGGNWQQPRGGNRTVVVPYGIPVGYPAPVYESAPQPQAQAAPTVVINQYFTNDSEDHRHVQPAPASAHAAAPAPAPAPAPPATPRPVGQRAPEERATITMLAFTDASVVSAIAYWTQDDTLHYITKNYEKKTVPVSLLDKATTTQLNGERNIEFRLESIR